jgi:hypothetical protein
MSYDYFLFAKPAEGEPTLDAIAAAQRPIGDPDAILRTISEQFPEVRWEAVTQVPGAWSGVQGPPEFIVTPESDGRVIAVKATRIEADEVRALARALACVVFDPQRGGFLDV